MINPALCHRKGHYINVPVIVNLF